VTVPREFDINPEFPRGKIYFFYNTALGVPTWHICLVSSVMSVVLSNHRVTHLRDLDARDDFGNIRNIV
jgi:hypothetical protein